MRPLTKTLSTMKKYLAHLDFTSIVFTLISASLFLSIPIVMTYDALLGLSGYRSAFGGFGLLWIYPTFIGLLTTIFTFFWCRARDQNLLANINISSLIVLLIFWLIGYLHSQVRQSKDRARFEIENQVRSTAREIASHLLVYYEKYPERFKFGEMQVGFEQERAEVEGFGEFCELVEKCRKLSLNFQGDTILDQRGKPFVFFVDINHDGTIARTTGEFTARVRESHRNLVGVFFSRDSISGGSIEISLSDNQPKQLSRPVK
jgi:hypothetical protein